MQDAADFTLSSNLDAEAIQKYIKLNAQIQRQNDSEQKISNSGGKPITIALKASKIIYDNKSKHYTLSKSPLKIVRGDSKIEFDVLKSDNDIIDLE